MTVNMMIALIECCLQAPGPAAEEAPGPGPVQG